MTTFYSLPVSDFSGIEKRLTISTGPVVISQGGDRVLLHISSSTLRYQFIGGRLDDSLSPRENALMRAREVVQDNVITLTNPEHPVVLLDQITRDGTVEDILLIHYRAEIEDESRVGEAGWFSLDEVEHLHAEGKTSSPNILIACKKFLS